jgi:hypothetical protein
VIEDYTARQSNPLRGIWTVEEFNLDGQPHAPLTTDAARWRRVVFDYPQMISVQMMTDARLRYGLERDDGAHKLSLTNWDDPNWKGEFDYQQTDSNTLNLSGKLGTHEASMKLVREQRDFLLLSRGFHWINERPFNR